MYRAIVVLVVGIFTISNPALSQSGSDISTKQKGPFINLHANGNLFSSNIGGHTLGGLSGAKIGLSFKRVSIFLQTDNAVLDAGKLSSQYEQENIGYISLGFGGRYHFQTSNISLIPYAEAGIHLQYFSSPEDDDNRFGYGGYGPSAGAGLTYFFSKNLAVDLGLSMTYGVYDHTATNEAGNQIDVRSYNTQLSVGISWYPFNN